MINGIDLDKCNCLWHSLNLSSSPFNQDMLVPREK